MRRPATGKVHRPRRLHVRGHPQWRELIPHLEELGINVAVHRELPKVQRAYQGYLRQQRDAHRVGMVKPTAEQCWKELECISAEAVGQQDSSDVDFGHASRVVGALARQGDKYVGRIPDLLGQKVEDFETDPMTWLEIFLVELAGEMRLGQAVPLVVKKLHECGEVLSEGCVEALGKIGTDAAAEAVAEGWLGSGWDYRVYAAGALEAIHSDTTVRKCLELLPQD